VSTSWRQLKKKLMTLSNFAKESMANYKTRNDIWRIKSPFRSLGLLLCEKKIIGAFRQRRNNTMFVSLLSFLVQVTEFAMLNY